MSEIISRIKSTLRTEINNRDPRLVRLIRRKKELNDLQAQELFDKEWTPKQIKEKQSAIKKATDEIKKLEIHFEEIKSNKMYLGAFEWRIEFPEVLDDEGNFLGFDCIIGNPPYIQLQSMGADSETLGRMGYQSYERTGDIYCLFYELGMSLLKPDYLLSFITSNKWMRAGYGASMRRYFAEQTNPIQLIDFAGTRVFDSATVDVNILTLLKQPNKFETNSCSIGKEGFSIDKLSDYFIENQTKVAFSTDESWVILSSIEQSIKRKIEEIGTPLKDWDINIYRGILTGYNEAFIISGEKRTELLAACSTEEERIRTDELIRPILRGRDIKRYNYDYADLWLINTHNGIKEKGVSRIKIDDYPAVKSHLDQYWDQIAVRADKGDTPYNLRNCAYMDDFNKQKIVWGNLNLRASFTLAPEGVYINAPATMIVPYNKYLLAVLNSKLADYYIRNLGVTRNGGYFEYKPMFIERLPIPQNVNATDINGLIDLRLNGEDVDEQLNHLIYEFISVPLK